MHIQHLQTIISPDFHIGPEIITVFSYRTGYEKGDTQWGRDQGWRVIRAEECWHHSLDPLMSEIRSHIGGHP